MDSTQVEAECGARGLAGSRSAEKGECVRIADGPLDGFEGIVIDRRENGRYLVQLFQGVYVETPLVSFSGTPTIEA